MEGILEILLNALPEAIGGLIAAGIIAMLSYFFVKRLKKETAQKITHVEVQTISSKPEICFNLPPRSNFIGREKEKLLVIQALNSRWPLIIIDGIGGIGKTSLALEIIYECLKVSKGEETSIENEANVPKFAGFIWNTAKDRELQLNDILEAIARTLDWPGIAHQPLEEKLESVRKLLQTKSYLLIVDNFETITDESIRDFLLNLPEPSKALITSREQKLPQAWAVSIKGLEKNEALTLIRNEGRRLGLKSLQEAEEKLLLHLYQATGGAPLAIKWAVGQIKQKGQSLDTVLSALHEAKGDIFEEVFARSWSLLTEDARKVLMVMPIFASSASKDAIKAASNVHHFALDESLGQLVQMWLVEVTDELEERKRRYSIHPLARAFSGARLIENLAFQKEVRERTVDYFLEFAKEYGGKNWWTYDQLELERENILSIITWCYDSKKWQKVIDFRSSIVDFLWIRGYWDDRLKYAIQAIEASKELQDERSHALCMVYDLGWTFIRRGNFTEARTWINNGLKIFKKINDEYGIALSLRNLGNIANREKKFEEAQNFYEKGLQISKKANLDYSAHLRISLGMLECRKREDYNKARQHFETAKDFFQKAGDETWYA